MTAEATCAEHSAHPGRSASDLSPDCSTPATDEHRSQRTDDQGQHPAGLRRAHFVLDVLLIGTGATTISAAVGYTEHLDS